MKYNLTEKDIRELRYATRMGYILPVLLIIILNLILFLVVYAEHYDYNDPIIRVALFFTIIIPLMIGFQMNRKFIADIRQGERIVKTGKIQAKESKADFNAGSGYVGKIALLKMVESVRYDLIIDNTRYRVEKEIFDNSEEGMEINLYFAPNSNYLLDMELRKSSIINNDLVYE